jgi:hypothetical protein
MKTISNYLLLLFSVSVFISCEKEYPYPSNDYPKEEYVYNPDGGLSRWGMYLLIDAQKYVTNTATGDKYKFDDFGSNSRSSLRWGGSLFDLETIVKDTTTWSFYEPFDGKDGDFVLNGDTTKQYLVHYSGRFTSITEDYRYNQSNIGGSARPFISEVASVSDKTIYIYLQEQYVTINGDACKYFTKLTFKKIKEW